MSDQQWITIPNWGDFQHYKNRTPIWIKTYTELLDSPDYRRLSFFHRGLLHGIWMLYATSRGEVPASPSYIATRLAGVTESDDRARRQAGDSRATGGRLAGDSWATESPESGERPVRMRDLKRLEQAGFITISASRQANGASTGATTEKRREEPPNPLDATRKPNPTPRQNGTNPRATPTPTFKCGIDNCPGSYPTKRKLEQHRELAHPTVGTSSDEFPF